MKKINFLNLVKENLFYKRKIIELTSKILKHGNFILGPELEKFENNFKNFLNCNHAVGVSSGTSALYIALKYLNLKKNDEVITVSNSYLSTVSSIILAGGKPVLVDVDENLNISVKELKKKINKNTKAIIVVHLTGAPCDIKGVLKLTQNKKICLIEDCAQAVGAKINNRSVGTFGDFGCFSFHPLKNLSGLGDGGAIICKSKKIKKWILKARNNGHPHRDECDFWSFNMRLDTIQASFLNQKLKYLKKVNEKRNLNAKIYIKELSHIKHLKLPKINKKNYNVFHLFVILAKKRDKLKKFLQKNKVETKIHYPKPIHLQKVGRISFKKTKLKNTEKFSKEMLSLPINQFLTKNEILVICKLIKKFYKR